jgi:hypothetical protein
MLTKKDDQNNKICDTGKMLTLLKNADVSNKE